MVYSLMSGRLGNLMFQYAAAKSFALRTGAGEVRGVLTSEQAKVAFALSKDIFGSLEVVEELPAYVKRYVMPRFKYDPIPYDGSHDIALSGVFQSEKYFNVDLVRNMYGISQRRYADLMHRYGDWLSRPNVTGISVRRGDYLRYPERFPFVGIKYFEECLRRLPDVDSFIVCSDDIAWCEGFFTRRFPKKDFLFVKIETILNQLYLQSLCRNNILSNSSFSWWGGWLNSHADKRVFMPSMWFGMLFKAYGWEWDDLYFDHVEIIPTSYSPLLWTKAILGWGKWYVVKTLSPIKQSLFKSLFGRTHLTTRRLVDIDGEK